MLVLLFMKKEGIRLEEGREEARSYCLIYQWIFSQLYDHVHDAETLVDSNRKLLEKSIIFLETKT